MHYCFFTVGSWEKNPVVVRARELGAALIEKGVKVSYLVDDVPFNLSSLPVHPKALVSIVPRGWSIKSVLARRRALVNLSSDYVQVLDPSPKPFLTLALLPKQNVVGDWADWVVASKNLSFTRHLAQLFLDYWLRNRSDVITVCSKYLQQRFAALGRPDAQYVPYAVYLNDNEQNGSSPFAVPTIVYMGTFYPEYDQDIIFEAAFLLKQQGQMPKFMIMGSGPNLEHWQSFVQKNGLSNVELPGKLYGNELQSRLRFAHVLLFPIRSTVLNMARCPSKTFAYAQAKRPIITSRLGEIEAVLGDNAIYVESTAQAFADSIMQIMQKPEMPDIDYHLEQHNWRARAKQLLDAIEMYELGKKSKAS
jgi:glycosyltransferase involved in cell wall biosynthesis